MLKTLKLIAARMDASGHPWLLGGDTALVLHGAAIASHDLLILTERIAAYEFGHQFREETVTPVQAERRGGLTTHRGTFRLLDATVHIEGDPLLSGELCLAPLPVREIAEQVERQDVGGVGIPLLPLEWLVFQELLAGSDDARLKLIIEAEPDVHRIFELLQRYGLFTQLKGRVQALFPGA